MELLLITAVIVVGVLHTLVPDHWAPIALIARQQQWTPQQTARAAFGAGLGHTLSTLAIGAIVWVAGIAFAQRFGHAVAVVSSLALIAFGAWIAIGAWRELRTAHGDHVHGDHVHGDHVHAPKRSSRLTLMLILGSSPMVEAIPTFFAAARFGIALIVTMSLAFAVSTIATYVALCLLSDAAMRRLHLGPLERYGEVLSGGFVALIGLVFLIWPVA